MDTGTKVRTALRIAVSLNTAVYAVAAAVNDLNIGRVSFAWMVLTIISDFVVSALTTYYNNDYTEEACQYTGEMRLAKDVKNGKVVETEVLEDESENS